MRRISASTCSPPRQVSSQSWTTATLTATDNEDLDGAPSRVRLRARRRFYATRVALQSRNTRRECYHPRASSRLIAVHGASCRLERGGAGGAANGHRQLHRASAGGARGERRRRVAVLRGGQLAR